MCFAGVYSSTSLVDHTPVVSPAVTCYQVYLKAVYRSSPSSRDAKWPPTPSNNFINLAVVWGGTCRDDYIGHILKGSVLEALQNRSSIAIEEILESDKRLILVEGAPGIGKSTLAWELCKKWEGGCSFMKPYSLVILLRLREEEVQRITSVGELFCSYESKHKQTLIDEISEGQCGCVLFILDGFDELPKAMQKQSFLLNLIKGHVLPESNVLLTSRPSAVAELLTACCPQKRIEILGFTQGSVKAYAVDVFAGEPEKLERFNSYISASNNPGINSLMYVPLNAAIIVQIFCDRRSDAYLPHTLTEVYTFLCLTILNRYLKAKYHSVTVDKFESLPRDLYQDFLSLSELALQGLKDENTIFHNVDPTSVHFGFLDAVSALYGGKVSYNFLHLTVQEFFAAYFISKLPDCGLELLQQHGSEERWNVVFRFVAGLTKFKGYVDIDELFITKSLEDPDIKVSLFFIQCLFEAQNLEFLNSKLGDNFLSISLQTSTFFDLYSLGYCIANITTGTSWKVQISAETFSSKDAVNQSFLPGLKTRTPSIGFINCLSITNHLAPNFAEFKDCSLQHLTSLSLTGCSLKDINLVHFSELLPNLTSLWYLDIALSQVRYRTHHNGVTKMLEQLAHSSVTFLDIHFSLLTCFLEDNPPNDWYVAFKNLIDPISGKLEVLVAGERSDNCVLSRLLSADSSLKSLYFFYDNRKSIMLDSNVVPHLRNNTCLTRLTIIQNDLSLPLPLSQIVNVLESNKTLEYFCLGPCRIPDDIPHLKIVLDALPNDSSLQTIEFAVFVNGPHEDSELSTYITAENLTFDSRVFWRDVSQCPIRIGPFLSIFGRYRDLTSLNRKLQSFSK